MKKNITMSHLYATLFSNPAPPIIDASEDNKAEASEATTIRPNKRARQFYNYHAERLGISLQALMAMTLEAVMTASTEPLKSDINIAVERFKLLFKQHGIAPIYINKIIDAYCQSSERKFPMGALTNDEILLSTLDTEYMSALSDIFGVSLGWLDGRELVPSKVLPIIHRDWCFKPASKFSNSLKDITFTEMHQLNIIVPESGDPNIHNGFGEKANMTIPVLSTTYGIGAGTKTFHFTTHTVEGVVPWFNEDARIGLKALLEHAKNLEIGVAGLTHSHDVFVSLMYGNMPVEALSSETPSYWSTDEHIMHDLNDDEEDVAEVLKRLSKLPSNKKGD